MSLARLSGQPPGDEVRGGADARVGIGLMSAQSAWLDAHRAKLVEHHRDTQSVWVQQEQMTGGVLDHLPAAVSTRAMVGPTAFAHIQTTHEGCGEGRGGADDGRALKSATSMPQNTIGSRTAVLEGMNLRRGSIWRFVLRTNRAYTGKTQRCW